MSDGFRRGDIVSYPYLWRWQVDENRTGSMGKKIAPSA